MESQRTTRPTAGLNTSSQAPISVNFFVEQRDEQGFMLGAKKEPKDINYRARTLLGLGDISSWSGASSPTGRVACSYEDTGSYSSTGLAYGCRRRHLCKLTGRLPAQWGCPNTNNQASSSVNFSAAQSGAEGLTEIMLGAKK